MKSKMLDLDGLLKTLTAKSDEIEACAAIIDKAKEAGDEDKVKETTEVFDRLEAESVALEVDVEKAKAHARRKAIHAEVAKLAAPAPAPAHPEGQTRIPAVARDHDAEDGAKEEAFFGFMRGAGGGITGEQFKLLEPSCEKLRNLGKSTAPVVCIPARLAADWLGENYARAFDRGKAILSVNNPITNPSLANNLFNINFIPRMQQLPMPTPVILNRVTIIPTQTGTVTFPGLAQTDTPTGTGEFGGVSFSWINEAAEKPETEPEFEQITIQAYEVAGYTEVSERALSRSAIGLEAYLRSLFASTFQYMLDNVIVNGSGIGQPLGIVNTPGIRLVARATAGAVAHNDFVNLKHAVRSYHRAGARFLLHDQVERANELAKDTLGRPLFTASTAGGPYDRIVGVPYDVSYNCPVIGTTGDTIYGNPSWYTMAMEEEVAIARSDHFQFKKDLVAFRVYAVVGGRPVQPRAFSVLQGPTAS